MKRTLECLSYFHTTHIYIPHGSDETWLSLLVFNSTSKFISHMVQMKLSSDAIVLPYKSSFISHMVQMKLFKLCCRHSRNKHLYPTWFRWNFLIDDPQIEDTSFISHMVQMKLDEKKRLDSVLGIYIPHGSDETSLYNEHEKAYILFISHMVQMKPLWSYILKPRKTYLYPTWFRWNHVASLLFFVFKFIYIPHGSDETQKCRQRWLNIRHIYIPHGSDETW